MTRPLRFFGLSLAVFAAVTWVGCASFQPRPLEDIPFRDRAQTQTDGALTVTVAVLSEEESEEAFGVPLYGQGIQPIWLQIENRSPDPFWFLPVGVDPNYFAPLEAAYKNHFTFSTTANTQMDQYFYEQGMGMYLGPGQVMAGFVFTNLDEGTKTFNVDLVGENHEVKPFTFFVPVPGFKADHQEVDFETLYSEDQIVSYDEEGLRKALHDLPCCTTNKDGTKKGDPLNLVVIGEGDDVYHAFIRSAWDETETVYGTSVWKTVISFILGAQYRYSPVSALYLYGRPQDVAFQKARDTIHERNHLRLWLTPMRFEGNPVWVGQISRDIGVRFTSKTVTTHKVGPDVDEARMYLIQGLFYSQGLARYGYVGGVGSAPISEPRRNLTGDPYFTDGFRAVLWVSSHPVSFTNVEFLKWDIPPER